MNNKLKQVSFMLMGLATVFSACSASDTGAIATGNNVVLFDMNCTIEKSIAADTALANNEKIIYTLNANSIVQSTASGDVQLNSGAKNLGFLKTLYRKGYETINKFDSFYAANNKFTVVLAKQCGKNVININSRTYINDIGAFEVTNDSTHMNLYYKENGNLNVVKCNLASYNTIPKPTKNQSGSVDVTAATGVIFATGAILTPNQSKIISIPQIEKTKKQYYQFKKIPLKNFVKQRGFDWKTDKAEIAKFLNIPNYKGTKLQNIQIQNYFLNKITIIKPVVIASKTINLTVSAAGKATINKYTLWEIVKLRSYNWTQDRMSIALEFGFSPDIYLGTKTQNLKIRSQLLDKISIK